MAANMLEMEWDEELADIAQRWADQCQFGHDAFRDVGRFEVGQNVYQVGSSTAGSVNWTRGIKTWYDEVVIFNNANVNRYS